MMALLVLLALIVGGVVGIISVYTGMVSKRNRFKNAFEQIDVQLKRRYDLIPNLVEVAKGYIKHERETLDAVVKARNQAEQANDAVSSDPTNNQAMGGLRQSEEALGLAIGKLMMLQEMYPDLKANETMRQLTEELASTEKKISLARQAFNEEVVLYNTAIESFPGSLVADAGGFSRAEQLTAEE